MRQGLQHAPRYIPPCTWVRAQVRAYGLAHRVLVVLLYGTFVRNLRHCQIAAPKQRSCHKHSSCQRMVWLGACLQAKVVP